MYDVPKMAGSAHQIELGTFCYLIGDVSDDTARKFFEKQSVLENWGYRELERYFLKKLINEIIAWTMAHLTDGISDGLIEFYKCNPKIRGC